MIPPLTAIGRIAGKHGFRGEINLIIDQDNARRRLKKGNFLFVEFDGKGVPFLIESVSASGNIIKLADIASDTDAAELAGKTILLEASAVGRPTGNQLTGLLGFVVHDVHAGALGPVTEVEEYPQGLMLTVDRQGTPLMIPAVEDWIRGIDEQQRTITMELPEGLTDL